MQAIWNGQVIAQSDDTVVVENNHYFPRPSLVEAHFERTDHTSFCPWKGEANYFTIIVGDARNENAAWIYDAPKEKAANIKDRVAFWKGVEVKA